MYISSQKSCWIFAFFPPKPKYGRLPRARKNNKLEGKMHGYGISINEVSPSSQQN